MPGPASDPGISPPSPETRLRQPAQETEWNNRASFRPDTETSQQGGFARRDERHEPPVERNAPGPVGILGRGLQQLESRKIGEEVEAPAALGPLRGFVDGDKVVADRLLGPADLGVRARQVIAEVVSDLASSGEVLN